MIVYRIAKKKYRDDLTGTGAEINGGRWNSKGTKILYTSSSIALTVADVAVHLPYGILPQDYFLVEIYVPDVKIKMVSGSIFQDDNWNSYPFSQITQNVGDNFVLEDKYLILKVPSVVALGDFNYLLNPHHKDFKKVKIIKAIPFSFDDRLFGSGKKNLSAD